MTESSSPIGMEREFTRRALELVEIDALPVLLERALAALVHRTGAREAYVELRTDEGFNETSLNLAAGCSPERKEQLQELVSRGIIGEAMASGRAVETVNAGLDPRFDERESVKRHSIESVLCVPIGKERPLGVIYLQGPTSNGTSAFPFEARADVDLLAQLVAMVAERILDDHKGSAREESGFASDAMPDIVCNSPALREVIKRLLFAAPLDVHILLTGPSGSGKSCLAHGAHLASGRRNGPFIELNCAALPDPLLENELFGADPGAHSAVPRQGLKGKIEAAEGGTLFLDEIGELSLVAQAKLLQLLQSKTYFRLGSSQPRRANVRVMAATNIQLKEAIREKRFREDLYFRLKVLEVKVPSLAERPEDVLPLARHFLRAAVERHDLAHKTLSPSAARAIRVTEWTGNVRELAHQIEAAALSAEQRGSQFVEQRDVFPDASKLPDGEGPRSLHDAVRAFQRKHILHVLESADWNMSEAARLLDVSRAHLYSLTNTLGLRRSPR
jgi:Nif-specific regulatory protein